MLCLFANEYKVLDKEDKMLCVHLRLMVRERQTDTL